MTNGLSPGVSQSASRYSTSVGALREVRRVAHFHAKAQRKTEARARREIERTRREEADFVDRHRRAEIELHPFRIIFAEGDLSHDTRAPAPSGFARADRSTLWPSLRLASCHAGAFSYVPLANACFPTARFVAPRQTMSSPSAKNASVPSEKSRVAVTRTKRPCAPAVSRQTGNRPGLGKSSAV